MTLDQKQAETFGFQEYLRLPYPETPLQIRNTYEADVMRREHERAREAAIEDARALADVRAEQIQFERDTTLGAVVKPRLNTLRGYKWVLKQHSGVRNIEFSPDNFGVFDGIIVKRSGFDEDGHSASAAFNKNNPHYQDFAPLRRNVALLRNYLMCQLFEDGNFVTDPNTEEGKKDLAHLKALNQMAERLGSALASESGSAKSFGDRTADTFKHILKGDKLSLPYTNAFMEAANIPDKGALVMYNYLMGLHETPTIKDIYSKDTPANWPLVPREDTPFSDENMRRFSRSSQMAGNTIVFEDDVMSQLRAPEKLSLNDRRISVDIGREILEKLRNLIANSDEQAKLNQFSDEDQEKSKRLLQVAMSFKDALSVLADAAPEELQNNKIFARSFDALEQLGHRMKADTFKALEGEYEFSTAAAFKAELDKTPERYKSDKSTDSLLGDVEAGLREAQVAQQRNAAKIAQREAQRAARRAAQSSQQTQQQTLTSASVRLASGASGAKIVQRARAAAAAEIAKRQREEAPLLTPEGQRRR